MSERRTEAGMNSKKKSVAELYPALLDEWHAIKNGEKALDDYTPGSAYRAWWICKQSPEHKWQAPINKS